MCVSPRGYPRGPGLIWTRSHMEYLSIIQGIRFLVEKGLLNSTPEDIALFLFVSQLDKGATGEYLGGG